MRPTHLPHAIDLAKTGNTQLCSAGIERYDLSQGSNTFTSLSERTGLKVLIEPSSHETLN